MKIDFDLTQFKVGLEKEKAKIKAATRPAAQAGAEVLYFAARLNVPISDKGHWFHGSQFKVNGTKYWFEAGTLRDAIYQVYSKDNSDDSKATYHVSWNHKEAPYGFMVENGTSRSAARSFIGKAAHENGDEAGRAMKNEFLARMKQ